jgi:proline iminopeptidase
MKKLLIPFLILLLTACAPELPEVGEFSTEINGVDIWYKVAGQGNQVLFFQAPAQGTGVDLFVQTMTPLEDDFTLVYYDPRGSGKSERAPDPTTINVGQVVEDLEALRSYLEIEEFALMGQSNGALVALNYAAKYPEHLNHLILTNQGIGDPPEYSETKIGELAMDERYLEAVMALGDIATVTNDKEFTEWFKKVGLVYSWDVDAIMEYADKIGPEAMDLETFFMISSTEGDFYGVFDELASIEIPTLVVAGEHDVFVSLEAARKLADGLANGELVVLKDTNHMPSFDNPEDLFASVTEFLNR